jgi:hypothetical protein
MAQTFTKKVLSNAPAGNLPIAISQTATAGNNIHLGIAAKLHQVLLTVSNIHTADVELTLEIGGVAAGNQQKHTIPSKRTVELPVIMIYGAVQIAGFADVASKLNITGEVNEIV